MVIAGGLARRGRRLRGVEVASTEPAMVIAGGPKTAAISTSVNASLQRSRRW